MSDILNTIALKRRERVAEKKAKISMAEMLKMAHDNPYRRESFALEKALKKEGLSFICEVKKASPSKGVLAEEFPYVSIAKEYEKAGASAISVLTEPDWFMGKDHHLMEIREQVTIPILRKDFTIDAYQIYEAKAIGADGVLLICSLLGKEQMKEYMDIAKELGLSVLVETHTEEEVYQAIDCNASVIGVNNRNLKTFEVDLQNSINLRNRIPKSITFISESGIRTADDIKLLMKYGVDGVLIGETLMKSENKFELLNRFRGINHA